MMGFGFGVWNYFKFWAAMVESKSLEYGMVPWRGVTPLGWMGLRYLWNLLQSDAWGE